MEFFHFIYASDSCMVIFLSAKPFTRTNAATIQSQAIDYPGSGSEAKKKVSAPAQFLSDYASQWHLLMMMPSRRAMMIIIM